jgi:transcriptional regulator with XRE-family HTH domain
MELGTKIKQLRLRANLTQEELAIACGTTKQTIHKYETGIISNIPASKIKLMSDKLNTTPAYLMGWEYSEKKNDIISDVILRLRSDDEFLKAVESMYKLSPEQLSAVLPILQALKQ